MATTFSGVRLNISWVHDIPVVKLGWDIVDGARDGVLVSCCFFVASGVLQQCGYLFCFDCQLFFLMMSFCACSGWMKIKLLVLIFEICSWNQNCGFTCVRLGSHNANEHLLRLNTSWSSGEESNQYHGQDLLAEKSLSVTLNDVNSRSEGQASS